MIGEIINAIIIVVNPDQLSTLKLLADAIEAPAIAPIRACEELLGIPTSQVIKFQITAAIKPHNTTNSPLFNEKGSTILFVSDSATPVKEIAPKSSSQQQSQSPHVVLTL